jgi:hypothetical protein
MAVHADHREHESGAILGGPAPRPCKASRRESPGIDPSTGHVTIAFHARLDDRTGIIYRHAVRLWAERIVY